MTDDNSVWQKVWKWLRWLLLAGIILFLLIWGLLRLNGLFQKPPETTQAESNQEILILLATLKANQEKIGDRLDDLEVEPETEEPIFEEPIVEEPIVEEPIVEEPVLEELSKPDLKTAADIRAFGKVIGWVTGGSQGQFVQGAQVSIKEDWVLNTLPSGYVFEYECVHYVVINDEVHAIPVCDGGLIRMDTDTIVPKGTIGTLWAPNAITAPLTEEWEEGFLDEPCLCADGDCRDE